MSGQQIQQEDENGYVDENGLRHFPDGSVLLENETAPAGQPIDVTFEENLVGVLPEHVLSQIGYTLKQRIEEDIQSRKMYQSSVAEIIKLLGIKSVQALENSDNNIDIFSSSLFETLLDITATVLNSIFPTKTPVSCTVLGESNQQLEEAAKRKAMFFNTYLRALDKGFNKELRRAIVWSVLTGSIYCKVYVDSILQRPTMRMIKPEDFIINAECSSHQSALRKTQIHRMDKKEYDLRKYTGEYTDAKLSSSGLKGDNNPIEAALDNITANDRNSFNEEERNRYVIYEAHTDFVVEEDPEAKGLGIPLPYIVTLDSVTGRIVRMIRNWEASDPLKRKREFFVNFSFLPALAGEGYGLIQYAGSMAQAATTITRQLIKSGEYSNFPAGFYVHGTRMEKNNLAPSPGEFQAIQTGGLPLNQAISYLPFQPPSDQLAILQQKIEESIKQPAAILKQQVLDMMAQAPMGSVLAAIEASQKVINYITQGYHESFTEMLQLFSDRFLDWLPDDQPYPFLVPGGEQMLIKSDFSSELQVVPATDPKLQNSTYRLVRAEVLLSKAIEAPQLHNLRNVFVNFYTNLDLSENEINEILLPDPKQAPPPAPLDPISENAAVINGSPVNAEITQDHAAHIAIHQNLAQNQQITGSNPAIAPSLQAHIAQHMAFQYTQQMCEQAGIELPQDPSQLPIDQQNQIAQAVAQALQQQQEQQPEQPNPEMILAQAEMMSAEAEKEMVQVRAQESQSKSQVDMAKLELEERKLELEKMKLTHELTLKKLAQQEDFMIDRKKLQLDGIKAGVPNILDDSQEYAQQITGEQVEPEITGSYDQETDGEGAVQQEEEQEEDVSEAQNMGNQSYAAEQEEDGQDQGNVEGT